jgi:hypothetical protein
MLSRRTVSVIVRVRMLESGRKWHIHGHTPRQRKLSPSSVNSIA